MARTGNKLLVIGSLWAATFSPNALSWEADVHYVLTKWLALKAGLSADDALLIAKGDQNVDSGALDAIGNVVWGACLKTDPMASRLVRDHHFASWAPIPSEPAVRIVKENSPEAQYELESLMNTPPGGWGAVAADSNLRSEFLFRFGMGLHVLQDSWSHAGEPDVSVLCDKNFAWGHPSVPGCVGYEPSPKASCGGYKSHDPDLTYKRTTPMVVDMARATFTRLSALANKLQKKPLQPFPSDDVFKFKIAGTKQDKLTWINARPESGSFSPDEKGLLCSINLPDGAIHVNFCQQYFSRHRASYQTWLRTVSERHCEAVPPSVRQALLSFFMRWATADATAYIVDRDSIGWEVSPTPMEQQWLNKWREDDQFTPTRITNLRLFQWRTRDHGVLAERGHDLPEWTERRSFVVALGDLPKYSSLEEAFLPDNAGCEGPISIGTFDRKTGTYLARARWSHAPDDLILVAARWQGSGPIQITSFESIVVHAGQPMEPSY